jgi:serine/threonine protein kinase
MIGVGTVIAESYRIEAEIGRGGMSVVYRATHLRLPTHVAIKVLYAHLSDGTAKSRFRREAELLATIKHPNIVTVYDFNELDGFPFFVMEFLEGEDLSQLLSRDRKLPLGRALPLVRQMADALGAAHARGIVHRDLKPQNVFLCRPAAGGSLPTVKLLDFGISKLLGSSDALTASDLTMGTPSYMSPEQARGESGHVDARADQFALALMLYEMLSGSHPFRRGDAPLMTMSRIVTEEAPAIADVPAAPMAALQRALAKQADARWPSVSDLVAALEQSADPGVAARPLTVATSPPRRARRAWALVALVVVVVAGALLALRHGRAHLRRADPASLPSPLPYTLTPPIPSTPPPSRPLPPQRPPAPIPTATPGPAASGPSSRPDVPSDGKKKPRRLPSKPPLDPQFRLEDPFAR